MKLANNKILVTGCASGIGLGLTERFIKENNTVIVCGRRESILEEVVEKFPSVITKVCDLSIEAERIEMYNWVTENHSDLTVLVNNLSCHLYKIVKASTKMNILSKKPLGDVA